MPDIGWMELLVIGVVALIVVGPKDLPVMFRRLGQMTGKVRAMAKEFQRAMDEAAEETGMTELNRELRAAAKFTTNPGKAGMDALKNTIGDLDIDPTKYEEGSDTRKMAEEKLAAKKQMREEVEARRQTEVEEIIAAKKAAAAASEAAAQPAEPEPEPAPVAEEPEIPSAARTGTDQP